MSTLSDPPRTTARRKEETSAASLSLWNAKAPAAIANAGKWSTGSAGWAAWQNHLRKRAGLRLPPALAAAVAPLEWGTERNVLPLLASGLSLESVTAETTGQLLEQADCLPESTPSDAVQALGCLALGYFLPHLVDHLTADAWWSSLDRLLEFARDSQREHEGPPRLAALLLGSELPLVLATLMPELAQPAALVPAACESLERSLDGLADDGLPHATLLAEARGFLASITRALTLVTNLPAATLSSDTQEQFGHLVRHTMRLTRRDGGTALVGGTPDAACFELALALEGDDDDKRVAAAAILGRAPHKKSRIHAEVSAHSEWSQLAVLRGSWLSDADRLTVAWTGGRLVHELETSDGLVFSGSAEPEIELNGVLLKPQGEWEQVCWQDDEDGTYLELERTLENKTHLQRQMFLSRSDRLLYLADAVVTAHAGEFTYRHALPLCQPINFSAAVESHEGWVVRGRRRRTIVPLALPEWRAAAPSGQLRQRGAGLMLELQARAVTGFYAPLWIDLNPKRASHPLTWRTLTVAETRVIQRPDVAAGYRLQIGGEQWLVYRSLGPRGNRTLLGHNLSSEFLIGRFTKSGEVEALIEVE